MIRVQIRVSWLGDLMGVVHAWRGCHDRVTSLRASFGRFFQDRHGATVVEFALVAVPFVGLLLAILEMAFVFLTSQALDAATQTAARSLLTGTAQQANVQTADQWRAAYLCQSSGPRTLPAFIDCSTLSIDVRTATSFNNADTSQAFYQDPSTAQFCPGGPGTITIVRIAYPMPVFLSFLASITSATFGSTNTGLVNDISNSPGWKHLLMGISVFQTEPYPNPTGQAASAC